MVVTLNSIDRNSDPVIELGGADRVLRHVFENLDIEPILDIGVKHTNSCLPNFVSMDIGIFRGV